MKTTILDGLNHQDSLQNSPIDERDAEKGLVSLFTSFFKIFKARMVFHLLHRDRAHFLRHQTGEPLVNRHAQGADALRAQSKRGGQDQVGAIRLEEIRRTYVGLKSLSDQRDNIHQSFSRVAGFGSQRRDFFQSQNVIRSQVRVLSLTHDLNPFVIILLNT